MNIRNVYKLLQYVYINSHLQVEALKLKEVISTNYETYERLMSIAQNDPENSIFLQKCANDYFMHMCSQVKVVDKIVREFINIHFDFFEAELGLCKKEIPHIMAHFWTNVSKNDLGKFSEFFEQKFFDLIIKN